MDGRRKGIEGNAGMQEKIAIIDLGSNSVRMIIMQVYPNGSYKMIDQAKEMVRLSEGMSAVKQLKPVAVRRTLNTLKLFKKLIESHRVDRTVAVATAAVRNAANGELFLERVREETGLQLEVITGEQEAYFDFLGVINTIRVEECIIIDTGGASTEIIWVEQRKVKEAVSIPYGAVTLTEAFSGKEEPSQEGLKGMEAFIEAEYRKISWLKELRGLPLVGLGGSVRTLAKIHKKKVGSFLEGLHNYRMEPEDVREIYGRVTKGKPEERKDIPGLGRDRADIIAGGLAPAKVLMEYVKAPEVIISGNGLREGVFFRHYLEMAEEGRETVRDVLGHSLDNILKNYDANIAHSRHVQKLALEMFDQLREVHGLEEEHRELLAVSALLHDIGLYVDYYNHHKHGFYLTLNSGINGLTHRQLIQCAFIVAMHRNEEFKQDWKEYNLFINKNDYESVRKLGMLVRIAEELDRNEYGSVEEIHCDIGREQVQMLLKTGRAAELEIAVAKQSSKAFEKLFGRKLVIV